MGIETKAEFDGEEEVVVSIVDEDFAHLMVGFRFEYLDGLMELSSVAVRVDHGQPPADRSEITGYELRAVYPWSRWEKAARTAAVEEVWEGGGGFGPEGATYTTDAGDFAETLKFAAIAEEYRDNVKRGLADPVSEIARNHKVKPQTARYWVYRARKIGILGPASGPTAGESGPGAESTVQGHDANPGKKRSAAGSGKVRNARDTVMSPGAQKRMESNERRERTTSAQSSTLGRKREQAKRQKMP